MSERKGDSLQAVGKGFGDGTSPSKNIIFITPAARGQHLKPRYAFVRNPSRELPKDHVSNYHHALYDIVDMGEGTERVMAYGVRHEPALFIVSALNAYEEAARLAREVPSSAA